MRKTVTVLFADLSGSTGFGERNDAEISRQVLARYHALLQETVDAHAGTVAKFMGDGMMATWGIPEVSEDDARRAVATGVALQSRFEDFAADVERRHGETLALRVGINTGEIVIGEGDADLIGDALNVAARLEHACRPGHVLVGEETWRLTRADVGYEALGEVTVAGRAQPVAIYEVALEADAEPEVAAPFVGRDAEMQRLVGVFDDARDVSRARLTTVLGSPGVGKTRLSRELCALLAEHGGAASVELRCDRAGEATFAPVAQLIRDASGLTDDLDADAARSAIGTLLTETEADHARVVDVLAGLVGVGPARSVEETFWGVRRLVEATAAERPLVIVIDDIQWAEPLLLDLIEHLAEWVADAAVLLVGLARPELREVRPSLAEPGRPVSAVVVLDGLDASATEALAAGLLGTDRLPAGLVERLPASTDGNPLFVRELVRMLVDDRVIRRRDDGEWELTIDADAVDVPPTIQSLLGARVERLPATEREVLEYASVVGAEFSLGALRELAGARAPVASLLESMRRKELVEPTGTYLGDEPVHRFHHVLIRDAAYRRLLKTTRAELHERVAAWTDRTAAELVGEHEAATAFHYEQAFRYRTELGSVDDDTARLGRRAAELLTTAAQRALGRDDLASAGALSARALGLLPESDTVARADLLQTGCECLLASGNGAAAKPLVEELGRSAGDDPRLAAWADCYAAQLVGLTDPEGLVAADAQAQAAAAVLTELGDGSGQAKAHQVRAGLLARLGRVGGAELELDLALAAARAADDRRRVTAVLGAAPDAALFGPSPVARAGGRCLDVVRLLRITTASPAVEAASNRCQAVLESLRGRFDVSRSMLASARGALEELGLRHGIAQTELYAGMVEMIAGDPHAAIPPLRAAYEGLGTLGVGADAGQAAALLAIALLSEGEVDEAELMAAESEALAGQNLTTAIGWRVARAEVLAARGDLAGAVALAEEAVEIAAGTDLVIDHADACVALAALRVRAGDAAGARAARADAKRLYEQKGATVPAERLDMEVVAPLPAVAASDAGDGGRVSRLSTPATELLERIGELYSAGRFDEYGALHADDADIIDHRVIVGTDLIGRNAHITSAEAYTELGFGSIRFEPIAVRGSRLVLAWGALESGTWGGRFLVLGELGPDGLVARSAWFDEDDLVAAQAELDAWYLAGEGAEHARVVTTNAAFFRALNGFDFVAMRELAASDFVYVDHRQLGTPTLDIDGFIEWQEGYRDVENHAVVADIEVRGRVDFVTAVNRAVDQRGGEILWLFLVVGVIDDGRAVRTEVFAPEDRDAALARFEELSTADPRTPRLENAASALFDRFVELSEARRFDEAGGLLHPDLRRIDHRANLPYPPINNSADYMAWHENVYEQFDSITADTIAIRGERLDLSRTTLTADGGFASVLLMLGELDENGLLVSLDIYDENDLDTALAELDARYVAGEGAEHADLFTAAARWTAAVNRTDFDALRELAAPGFRFIDRRQLGAGTVDLDGLIERFRQYADIDSTQVIVDLRFRGRAIIATAVNGAVGGDGGEFAWSYHSVGVVTPEGRTKCIELFDEADSDAALARFEELSAESPEPRTPRVENAQTRAADRYTQLVNAGRWDEATECLATDFTRVDHRSGVAAEPADRGAYMTALRGLFEVGFTAIGLEHLAVRGERLALTAASFTTDAGSELEFLIVADVDGLGRISFMSLHDPDDLDAALVELDERYLVGEGAEHADVLRAAARVVHAFDEDPDALADLCAPDFTLDDHRQLMYGAGDRDYFVSIRRASPDDHVRRTVAINRRMFVRGRALLVVQDLHREDPDGAEYRWGYSVLAAFDASTRLRRLEWFDEDDWEAALARLDELGAAPVDLRTPRVENAATRFMDAWLPLYRSGRFDEIRTRVAAGEFFAEHYERVDRRPTVSAPDSDVRGVVDSLEALYDLGLVEQFVEPIAVRGERLMLFRPTFRTSTGTELVLLNLAELDVDGRVVFTANYDEAQLAEALAELDDRFAACEGAEHAPLLATFTAGLRAMQSGDLAAMQTLATPEFDYVDHRPTSFGALDAGAFVEMARSYEDIARMSVVQKVYFADRALIARLWTRGVTAEGAEAEWVSFNVWLADDSGRALHGELFGVDDWDAALARFDELSAASPSDPRTLELENSATRAARLSWRLLAEGRFDELPAVAPGFSLESRRRFLRVPGDADWVDALMLLIEQYSSFVVEPLAIRGRWAAVVRFVAGDESGNESAWIATLQLDESDRWLRQVNFDEEDEIAAIDLLDEWYLEGEGAADAQVLTAHRDGMRRYHALDWDGIRAMGAPDFEFVDHRPLPWPTSDADGLLRLMQERVEQVPDIRSRVRKLFVQGRAILSIGDAAGTDEHGGLQQWPVLTVYEVDPAGANRRIEYFALEQWDAALARFDELAPALVDDARTPEIVNASSRAVDRLWALAAEQRFDDVAAMLAPDVERVDHRHGVALAPIAGAAAYLDLLRASFGRDEVERVAVTPLAVRGERLSLTQVVVAVQEFEITVLLVAELDADGRIAAVALYDEDDLAAAQDELDDRFVAGEAGPHAPLMVTARAYVEATNAKDLATVAALNAPGVTLHDHRLLGALDATNYLPVAAEGEDIATSMLVTKYLLAPRALLAPAILRGIDAYGGEALWFVIVVDAFDADARYRRVDFYDAEDWDAALARFDEIAAESMPDSRHPRAENAVTRILARDRWKEDHDPDHDRAAGVAPDVVFEDRRSGVSLPELRGVDQLRENMAAQDESFGPTDFEPIAVRGEHLALVSTRSTSESGFELTSLMVFETDDADRVRSMVSFDPDALAAAIDELDDRFLAGEGAPDGRVLSVVRAAFHGIRDEDTDALGRLLSPRLVTVDHQRIGLGTADRDSYLERERSDQQVMRRDREYPRKGFVSGAAVLVVYESQRLDPHGGEVLYQSYFVARVDASDWIDRMEWFDLDDWDAALARFDELAAESPADPRHPRAENAATRTAVDVQRLVAANRLDEAERFFADDYVRVDRRSGVTAPDARGGRAFLDAWRAFFDVGFSRQHDEYLAVRGERHYLIRTRFETPDGDEVVFLQVTEFDAAGRVGVGVNFDEDDLAAAIEELDARYVASGLATDAEVAWLSWPAALNRRDYDALTALLSPDFVSIDHSPLGFPPADRHEFVHDHMAGLDAMVPSNVRFVVKLLPAGDTALVVTRVIGTTTDGSEYEWTPVFVTHRGPDGLGDRIDAYAPEDWDAALARFDELVAGTEDPPTSPPSIENRAARRGAEWSLANRATAAGERAREAALRGDRAATLDAFAPEFRRIEARPRAISGERVVGRDLYVDGMLAGPDAGLTHFDADALEVVGDDHALTHVRWHNDAGSAQEWLFVGEADADGRLRRIANFDPDDRAAASALLHAWASGGPRAGDRLSVTAAVRNAALDRGDRDAVLATYAPDFVREDRRRGVNFGTSDREETVDALLAGNDVGLGERSFTTLEVVDDEHVLVELRMRHTDGFELVYLLALEADEEGRLRRAANFDLEDRDLASALLHKWAGGAVPTPDELDQHDRGTSRVIRELD